MDTLWHGMLHDIMRRTLSQIHAMSPKQLAWDERASSPYEYSTYGASPHGDVNQEMGTKWNGGGGLLQPHSQTAGQGPWTICPLLSRAPLGLGWCVVGTKLAAGGGGGPMKMMDMNLTSWTTWRR